MMLTLAALLMLSTVFPTAALGQVAPSAGTLESTAWRWVHSVMDEETFVAPVDRDRYTVSFGPAGILNIRADCNQVSGTYRQIGRRLTLQLGPTTLAACPPGSRADEFLQQLGAVVSQVATDTVLVLNLRQDAGSMVFEPPAPLSLTDTNWLVLSYNNGRGAVTTPLLETELTVSFGEDGTISGSSGCNTYNGTYTAEGESLTIGPLTTTRLACAPPVMDQEQAFLRALQASTRYELTADRLTLRNDERAIQVDLLPQPIE